MRRFFPVGYVQGQNDKPLSGLYTIGEIVIVAFDKSRLPAISSGRTDKINQSQAATRTIGSL
jgi:hypothetical protein